MTSTLDEHWRMRAACRGMAGLFYPERGQVADSAAAISICSCCGVRAECLEHALDHAEMLGVWGGTNESQRKLLRRARLQEVQR